MNTSDLKDSYKQTSPLSRNIFKTSTASQPILRLKKSPSFKITLFKPKTNGKAYHAHSSSADFMEIFREVACYQPTALDSPTNTKKTNNKMQPKASLPSSTGDSYSKVMNSWRQKDDSPVEPFLAVHNIFGKQQDSILFSDTLTSFFMDAPNKEVDNHNQSSGVPFYLEEKKSQVKNQSKTPVPNLKNLAPKSSYDLLIPLKQKSDRTDEIKTNLKPYKIYNNYRKNNYTVREYDQCVSKELIDMINSKEKSSIISHREIPPSPIKVNGSKESIRSTSVPRATMAPKILGVSNITINAEWRSGLTKAKSKPEKKSESISGPNKEEGLYKHPVLKNLQTRRNWVKKRGQSNSTKKLNDKYIYSWGQIVDRNTIAKKFPLVLNFGKEKDEEESQLCISNRRISDDTR